MNVLLLAPLLLLAAEVAASPCQPCAELHRVPLGYCACGQCVAGFTPLVVGGVAQAACLSENACDATPGTYWSPVHSDCRVCPEPFVAVDCQPCTNASCTACGLPEVYDASGSGCSPRSTGVGALPKLLPESATRDDADCKPWTAAELASGTTIPWEPAWPAMLVAMSTNSRLLPDARGNVLGATGRMVPLAQRTIALRCGSGHFVPEYLQSDALTVPCTLLACKEGTVDHDNDATTPCRRSIS